AGQDLDEIAIVPIRSARRNLMGDFPLPPNALQQISLRFNNGVQENILSERIAQRLRKTHKLAVSEILDFRI
ncbi:peptide ABC transporter permease, partial [Xanthomonas vasicola]